MAARKKVIHITIHLPWPTNHGASLFNSFKLFSWLNKNHDLYFACLLKGDDVKYKDDFVKQNNIQNYYFEPLNVERNGVNLIKSYLKGKTINMFRSYSPSFKKKIEAIAGDYDVIVAEHYEAMQYVPKNFKGKVVFRTHNAEYLIWSRYAEVEKNPVKKMVISLEANRIKKWELRYVKKADVVLGGTNDNEIHEPDLQKRKLKFKDYLHIGEDDQIKIPIPQFEQLENSLVYVGTLTWEANIEGLIWFVDGCWNNLKKEYPELKLYIIGKKPDERLVDLSKKYSNIIITGFVEDLEMYFTKCKVNVIPLRFGSGMKVKTINGLCRGIPMVTTSIGAEGLQVTNGKDIFIENELEPFAEKIKLLLRDKATWESIANESKKTATKYYTWQSLYKILEESI
jgi:glycosyltransferase involved in cell wall biosynthesis